MRIGITGATGLIGNALGRLVAAHGHEVIAFTRNPAKAALPWAAEVRSVDMSAPLPLDASGIDALVHLAGESILGWWTEAKKQRIRDSRVDFTQRVTRCLAAATPRPATLLCGSAVGFYGDRGDELLTEASSGGSGFLAQVCTDWEAAALRAEQLGVRVVLLRTGVVLGIEGGAFPLMRRAFAFGLGGRLGKGGKWMPWIHLDDEVRLILWTIEREAVHGPVNAVGPGAVTNADFTRELASVLHRPAFMHVPDCALKLGLGEMAGMVLASQRAAPTAALAQGFEFEHPSLAEALQALAAG